MNTDSDRTAACTAVARHRLSWRSWWAGGPDGDIPTQWHVSSYPSLFVIDARGVVRARHVQPGPELEHTIDMLLAEIQ